MIAIDFSLYYELTMQYKVLAPEGKTRSSATKTSRMVTVLNIKFLMTLLNMRLTIRRMMMMMRKSITFRKMSAWLCLSRPWPLSSSAYIQRLGAKSCLPKSLFTTCPSFCHKWPCCCLGCCQFVVPIIAPILPLLLLLLLLLACRLTHAPRWVLLWAPLVTK